MGPLELDRLSQRLEAVLLSDAAAIAKQLALAAFFRKIRACGHPEQYLSFFDQFSGWVPLLSEQAAQTNCAPECHLSFLHILDLYQATDARWGAEWRQIKRLHQLAAARAYLYAGAGLRAVQVLNWPETTAYPSMPSSVLDMAAAIVQAGEAAGYEAAGTLTAWISNWRSCQTATKPATLNVLLATEPDPQLDAEAAGVLTVMEIAAHRNQGYQDVVLLNNRLPSGDTSLYYSFLDGVSAARSLLVHHASLPFFNLHFSFPDKNINFSGQSQSLAAALLAYAAMATESASSCKYSFRQNAALTGCIAADGRLLPVDAQALQAKLTTAFFSPMETVIIPEQNLPQAKRFLDSLHQQYPDRRLKLTAYKELVDVLQDSDIIIRELYSSGSTKKAASNTYSGRTDPVRRHLSLASLYSLKSLLNKKYQLAALFAFTMILVACFYVFKPDDRNPQYANIKGSRLRIFNRAGDSLCSHDFGFLLNTDFYGDTLFFRPKLLKITDINADGYNEVLLGLRDNERADVSGTVYCFSHLGQILWTYKAGDSPFTKSDSGLNHLLVQEIRVCKWRTDQMGIIVLSHQMQDPAVITLLSASGKCQGEYWNSGHIVCFEFADLDEDGIIDILAGGYHDESGQGMLVVLDPRQMAGAGPTVNETPSLPRSTEKYYLLFPATIYVGHGAKDKVSSIKVAAERVHVVLTNFYLVSVGRAPSAEALLYTFDKRLHLETCLATDYYRRAWYEMKRTDYEPSAEFTTRKNLMYWSGERWLTTTTMTNQWLKDFKDTNSK